jgi:hypothetical protein
LWKATNVPSFYTTNILFTNSKYNLKGKRSVALSGFVTQMEGLEDKLPMGAEGKKERWET